MEQAQQLVFTERAQALASDFTTVSLYQILLGRDPENSFVIEEAKSQPIAELMRSFLASTEFADFVLTPIREGQRLRHELTAPAPTLAQRSWITSLLVLPPSQEKAIASASTWREFLSALLVQASSGYQFDKMSSEYTVGRIEECGVEGIRGWALRVPSANSPVEVECFIGAYWAGRAACSEQRPDLNDLFGCEVATGFSMRFESDAPIDKFAGLEVRLLDAQHKTLIYGPSAFEFSDANQSKYIGLVHHKLATIEWQVAELRLMLEGLVPRTDV